MTQAYSEKNPSAPIRSRTLDLPITSSDALPLSYRRLVGAKAIKLGSWDKHPAYVHTARIGMPCVAYVYARWNKCDGIFLLSYSPKPRSQARI